LQGTNDLMETYRLVKAKLNPALKLLGILITMYDPRTTLAKEVVAEIRNVFAGQVLSTVIRRCVKLEESPVSAQSVVTYAPKSIAAEEYQAAYEELMGRLENHA
jgi:chromosome partitioning protein